MSSDGCWRSRAPAPAWREAVRSTRADAREPGCDDDGDVVAPTVRNLLLLDAAAAYCSRGEAVFFLRGKFPLVAGGNGFHDATTDISELRRVFGDYRGATGIGMAIRPGTFVVDCDPRHGGDESLRALEVEHGPLPETEEQATGSNGRHLIFAASTEVRQLAGFRPGLDTRAAGKGYIVVEPSIHPITQKAYRWVRRMTPAPAPQWLLDLVGLREVERVAYVPPVRSAPAASRASRWARAALEGLAQQVAGAHEGERNDTLNRAAFRLGRMIAGGLLDPGEVRSTLRAAGVACGLPEREVDKVLR